MTNDSTKHKWLMMDWDGTSLRPHSSFDNETLHDRLRRGESVLVHFKQARYLPRHRLYWATIREVVKNTDLFATEKSLHQTLLLACGVVDPLIDVEGHINMIPSSTSFDEMDEADFQKYFDQAMVVISTKIIPGIEIKALLKEARQRSGWKEK